MTEKLNAGGLPATRKKYFGEIRALDWVSFTVPDGQVSGLLGPNSAGKTTALRIIAGLIKPMSGGAMDGSVTVQSTPKRGSNFNVALRQAGSPAVAGDHNNSSSFVT